MNKLNQSNIRRYFHQVIKVSNTATKPYKIVMFIMFLLQISYNFSMIQAVGGDSFDDYRVIVIRSFVDALLFVVTCHYLVRSYLKINLISVSLTLRRVLFFLLYLVLVSIIFGAITYGISKVDFLSYSDIEGLKSLKEALGEAIPIWGIGLIFVINSLFMFLSWSIIYLFWNQQLARKAMQQQMHQVQIQQLTNQLSPHFLFNSLNSIRALIYEDQDKAADTVTLLSELFRCHLQAHLKPKSSLEEEWRVTQQYLAIEQIRLEERLSLTVELAPELMAQSLPTLTLLTLVENAIKHGISPSAKTGFIRIIAKPIDNQSWSLEVDNSVYGKSNAEGTQTGLINIYKRLELMFGNNHSCHQSETANQFTIKMELARA